MENKTLSEKFHWMYGIEEYLGFIKHQDFDKYMKIIYAIHHGDMWAIRDLVLHEINRGVTPLNEQFVNTILLHYLNPLGLEGFNNREIFQFIAHSIDDELVRDISSWSIKWGERANLTDHFSRGQMKSKLWLVDELSNVIDGSLGTVLMYGGWYATVANLLSRKFNINRYYSLDVDPTVSEISENFNYRAHATGKFKAITHDVNRLIYDDMGKCNIPGVGGVLPNVVINTSCEHMTDQWFGMLPRGQFVVLQTNNYFKNSQHINCVSSVEEALAKYKFTQVLYSGELETFLYDRYMIIGIK
jgi:hypothetical protein